MLYPVTVLARLQHEVCDDERWIRVGNVDLDMFTNPRRNLRSDP